MCGILGIAGYQLQRDSVLGERYDNAVAMLNHRGPDANGQYRDTHAWLGHTRLSILDLSAAGNQPMKSADGRFVISFNGEIYNYRELAKKNGLDELQSSGDTAVLLQLFAKLGVDSLTMLNGMFAFALYDSQAKKLWLIRDRLGIKPLYYRIDEGRLTFASEVKGIIALNGDASTCDIAALHEWLYYGNPLGERTLYSGIKQLLPGHYLEVDLGTFEHEIRAYWTLRQQANGAGDARESGLDVVSETRRLLEQAVTRQLVSDVPVGVFLSGGIDSSAIVAFASRHYGERLATYSAGFDFARNGGELPKARRIAERYGTDHHEVHIEGGAVGDLIEKMVMQHDMPFADAANIPLYLLASQISGTSKVILQGDGGDELFGGYRRYSTLNNYLPMHAIACSLMRLDRVTPRTALQYRVQRYIHAFAAEDLATTMALLLTVEDRLNAPAAVFAPELRTQVEQSDPFARFREVQNMFDNHDIGNQMSFVDLMIVLPDTYLEKVDRATMAASLEVRVPYLDHDLVNFVVRQPGQKKMPWGKKKWLLKKALRGIVPSEILDGPKTGLEVPYGKWLQGKLKPMFFDYLEQFSRSNSGVLDANHVSQLFERTSSGKQDHSYMLWKVLNFMIWVMTSKIDFSDRELTN
jgi:asparagine synthase (glutamine-hydrolysing)